jgi:hypothetical protein
MSIAAIVPLSFRKLRRSGMSLPTVHGKPVCAPRARREYKSGGDASHRVPRFEFAEWDRVEVVPSGFWETL